MANEIDPATVQRCIEVLRGKGEYKFHGYGLVGKPRESWTYTTHPTDLLQALLPEPEKSEAEKLVDEWQGLRQYDWFNRDDTEEQVSLVQFVLDKTQPDAAVEASDKSKWDVCVTAVSQPQYVFATPDSHPQYVFGPWIEWHGGECPVPSDWMVETVFGYESLEHHEDTVIVAEDWNWNHKLGSLSRYNITHYRVRFEVGKWYDWAGGPCPVFPEQKISIGDSWAKGRPKQGCEVMWNHTGSADITRFRCVE